MLITILVSCHTKDPQPKSLCDSSTNIQHVGPSIEIHIQGDLLSGTALTVQSPNGSMISKMVVGSDFVLTLDMAKSGQQYSLGVNQCPLSATNISGNAWVFGSQNKVTFKVVITQGNVTQSFYKETGEAFFYDVR